MGRGAPVGQPPRPPPESARRGMCRGARQLQPAESVQPAAVRAIRRDCCHLPTAHRTFREPRPSMMCHVSSAYVLSCVIGNGDKTELSTTGKIASDGMSANRSKNPASAAWMVASAKRCPMAVRRTASAARFLTTAAPYPEDSLLT